MMKKIVQRLLERKVKAYLEKHKPILVVVVGSVGKTSTKQALATVLSEKYRVRAEQTNHNTEMSVPTALMGVTYPSNPHSVSEWLNVLKAMNLRIKGEADVDVIVQELGTDKPGDISAFSRYLTPDVAVVTAVSEEHMEFFKTLDAVAREELSVAAFSKLTVVNRDDVATDFAKYASTSAIDTYGLTEKAEYRLVIEPANPLDGRIGRILTPEWGELTVTLQLIGDHSLKSAVAAACVGAKLGLTSKEIVTGMTKIKPVAGRMRLFAGVEGSIVIDDTYNASPLAVEAALKTLYSIDSSQRIAVLGSMNELGMSSPQAHEKIGLMCDPTKLDWVITIGADAQTHLAPAAQKQGCQVKSFTSPYEAGGFAHKVLEPHAVVLVKGSQNGVFAEEAVKVLLHDAQDEDQLVRQSASWMTRKNMQFDQSLPED